MVDAVKDLGAAQAGDPVSVKWNVFERYAGLAMAASGRTDTSALEPLVADAQIVLPGQEPKRIKGADETGKGFILQDGSTLRLDQIRGARIDLPAAARGAIASLQADQDGPGSTRDITMSAWRQVKTDDEASPRGVVINQRSVDGDIIGARVFDPSRYETEPLGGSGFVRRATPPAVFAGSWSRFMPETRNATNTERQNASAMWDHVMRTLARRDQGSMNMLNEILSDTKKALEKPVVATSNRGAPVGMGQAETGERQDMAPSVERRLQQDDLEAHLMVERPRMIQRGNNPVSNVYFVAPTQSEARIARRLATLALSLSGYDPKKGPDSIRPFLNVETLPDRVVIDAWMAPVKPAVTDNPQRRTLGFVAGSSEDAIDVARTCARFAAREARGNVRWLVSRDDDISANALREALGQNADIERVGRSGDKDPAFTLARGADKVIAGGDSDFVRNVVAEAARLGAVGVVLDREGHPLDRFQAENEALREFPSYLKRKAAERLLAFGYVEPNSTERMLQVFAIQKSLVRSDSNGQGLNRKDIAFLISASEDIPTLAAMASDKDAAGYGPDARELYRRGLSRTALDALSSPRVMLGAVEIMQAEAEAARQSGSESVVLSGRGGLYQAYLSGNRKTLPDNGVYFADDGKLIPEMASALRNTLEATLDQGLSPVVIAGSEAARHLRDLLESRRGENRELAQSCIPTILTSSAPDRYAMFALDYVTDGKNTTPLLAEAAKSADRSQGFVDPKAFAADIASRVSVWDQKTIGFDEWAVSKNQAWEIKYVQDKDGPRVELHRYSKDRLDDKYREVAAQQFNPDDHTSKAAFLAKAFHEARSIAEKEAEAPLNWRQSARVQRENPYGIGQKATIAFDARENVIVAGGSTRPLLNSVSTRTDKAARGYILSEDNTPTIREINSFLSGEVRSSPADDLTFSARSSGGGQDTRARSMVLGNPVAADIIAAAMRDELTAKRNEMLDRLAPCFRKETVGSQESYLTPAGQELRISASEAEKPTFVISSLQHDGNFVAQDAAGDIQTARRAIAAQALAEASFGCNRLFAKIESTRSGRGRTNDGFDVNLENSEIAALAAFGRQLGWIADATNGTDDGKTKLNRVATSPRGDVYRIVADRATDLVELHVEGPRRAAAVAEISRSPLGYFFDKENGKASFRNSDKSENAFPESLKRAQVFAACIEINAIETADKRMLDGWSIAKDGLEQMACLRHTSKDPAVAHAHTVVSRTIDGQGYALAQIEGADRVVTREIAATRSEDRAQVIEDVFKPGARIAVESTFSHEISTIGREGLIVSLSEGIEGKAPYTARFELTQKAAEIAKAGIYVAQMNTSATDLVPALAHAAALNATGPEGGAPHYPVVTPKPSKSALNSEAVSGQVLILRGFAQDYAQIAKSRIDMNQLSAFGKRRLATPAPADPMKSVALFSGAVEATARARSIQAAKSESQKNESRGTKDAEHAL